MILNSSLELNPQHHIAGFFHPVSFPFSVRKWIFIGLTLFWGVWECKGRTFVPTRKKTLYSTYCCLFVVNCHEVNRDFCFSSLLTSQPYITCGNHAHSSTAASYAAQEVLYGGVVDDDTATHVDSQSATRLLELYKILYMVGRYGVQFIHAASQGIVQDRKKFEFIPPLPVLLGFIFDCMPVKRASLCFACSRFYYIPSLPQNSIKSM